MFMITNSKQFLIDQYGDSSKLDIRIQLHEMYSTNKTDWHEWVFDQLKFDSKSNIIEFGCGAGSLWGKNKENLLSGWTITLTDLSEGMLNTAKQSIGNFDNITYKVMDIQAVDAQDSSFDIAIANHMLYHVPNVPKALAEIQRIMKPDGLFYATTNGRSHIREIYDFVAEFDPSLSYTQPLNSIYFGLENGEELLRDYFEEVQLVKYPSSLQVTNAQDLADYMFSIGTTLKEDLNNKGSYDAFIEYLESKKTEQGYIHISKDSGVFVCHK